MRVASVASVAVIAAIAWACQQPTKPLTSHCNDAQYAITDLNPEVGVAGHFGVTPIDSNRKPMTDLVTNSPALGDRLITFSSTNPDVVRIHHDSGRYVAMAQGQATVQAFCTDATPPKLVATVLITVQEKICPLTIPLDTGGIFTTGLSGLNPHCGDVVTVTARPNLNHQWVPPWVVTGGLVLLTGAAVNPAVVAVPATPAPPDPGPDYLDRIGWAPRLSDVASTGSSAGPYTIIGHFASSGFGLTVLTSGTGAGKVTVTPAMTAYPPGTPVTLTATANTGSAFAGWQGACQGQGSVCSLVINGATTTTAIFNTAVTYTLTTSKAGTGTGTITQDKAGSTFSAGTVVTLTAAAATGSTFAGWSGACSGSATTCAVTMDANKSAVATFNLQTPTTYTLTVNTNGTGSGTVSRNPVGPTYSAGTNVTLTAVPSSGSTFGGWSGACSGTSTTCVVTMNSNLTATATFNGGSTSATYRGPLNSSFSLFRTTYSPAGCTWSVNIGATLTATLQQTGTSVTGSMRGLGTITATLTQGPCLSESNTFDVTMAIGGTTSNITGSATWTDDISDAPFRVTFTGALSGGTITGQLSITYVDTDGHGGTTTTVTLR